MSDTTPRRDTSRPDPTRPVETTPTTGTPDTGAPGTGATRPLPTPSQAPPSAPVASAAPAERPLVRGPYLSTVVVGLLCLAVAGLVLAQELGGITLDWGEIGPLGLVVAGGVLVALGGIGLLASRRRR